MRRFLALILCLSLLALPVRAEEGPKYVALTFDDGPAGRFTRRLLDGLAQREARATFLLCGYRIKDYPQEAQRIFREGHEIGIHGDTHASFCSMTEEEITREIRRTMELLPEGCQPRFLRPPGGSCSQALIRAAESEGLSILS